MSRGGFGLSVVVVPAYLLSLKIDFLTFGMAEYCLQGVLLVLFCLIYLVMRDPRTRAQTGLLDQPENELPPPPKAKETTPAPKGTAPVSSPTEETNSR